MNFPSPDDFFLRLKGAARDRSARLITALGIDLYMRTDDRRILESVILPYYAGRKDFKKLIFIGCEWYTKGYNKIFTNHEYWTLDKSPCKEQYGSRLHIEDNLENLDTHFQENELDLIICNGVLGWGLDEPARIERAFTSSFHCLRPGGHFILGWNDTPDHRPLPLNEITALKAFAPCIFPALSKHRYLTNNPNRHIYNFYHKPAIAPAQNQGRKNSPGKILK